MIARGIDAGAFTGGDPRILGRPVLGVVISVWRWYRPDGDLTLAQITETVTDVAVRMVWK
ncbi:hypothetical protein AB4305_07110 [Nocardia sp. 2YAB30]|uniref:hypothetical protein n=1 Tax=unclassified Nocardia TaxID=2637762 RepID=UPI003F9E1CB5